MDSAAGPLAEFTALRAEILQCLQLQWNIFALQLAVTATLFSFSLSSSSRTEFLLILPFVTYALSGRYLYAYYDVERAAEYIMKDLSDRIPGGLHWETWHRQHRSNAYKSLFGFFAPLPMIFPGTSAVAIAWTAPYIWLNGQIADSRRIALGAAWIVSLAFAGISFYDIKQSGTLRSGARGFVAKLDSTRHRI